MQHDAAPGYGIFRIVDPETGRELARSRNLWTYFWGDSAARLFATADPMARVSMMYVSFANLSAPGDTIDPPTITRADGLSYFQGLSSDPVRDYVRVPLIGVPTLDQDPDAAGTPYLATGQVNRLTAIALASGPTGMNGKPFANTSNSTITGVALVAARVPDDPTQDVVCFVGFNSTGQQALLPPGGVVTATYAVTFT